MKNRYYVYIYLDPTRPGNYKYGKFKFDYEPFYVGKGTNNRDTQSKNRCVKLKIDSLNESGHTYIIKRVYDDLTEDVAYSEEIRLIELIGRKIKKEGPLLNILVDSRKCEAKARKTRNNKIKTNQENTVAATCDLLDALKEIEEASKNTSPLYKWSRLRKDAIDNITDLFN